MSQPLSSRAGVILLVAGAAIGLAVALYAYFAPLTGVTGTVGALVVVFVCAVIAVMALMLATPRSRGMRTLLRVLILLALAGTCFAGALLHQWWICAAMGAGAVGLILDLFRPAAVNRVAYS